MSCPYSVETLEKWEDVYNPMGPACDDCFDCECPHWDGSCLKCDREYCPDPDRSIFQQMQEDELKQMEQKDASES